MVLGSKIIVINYVVGFFSVLVLLYILNIKQNSSFKLMWIIIIVAVPIVGVAFFLYTRFQYRKKMIADRLDALINEQKPYMLPKTETITQMMADMERESGIFKYLFESESFPVYDNACVKYYPLGEDQFEDLRLYLKKAKKFIFLEYFIIDKGEMWDEVLGILEEKVKEGVEVRLMYDGTCTLSLLPIHYPKQIQKLGIQCKIFSPMRPVLTTHQNNRDHRKIVVIDGQVAFTGGINLADEYINQKERFGHWKDTGIMVQGEAVRSFTMLFLQMWNIDSTERERYDDYIADTYPISSGMKQGGYITPYGDSPLDDEEVGQKVYLDIINRANEYVHITTPYLIIDDEMTNALIFAAQRGIDVKLILPHIPDKKYAYWLARTYYAELTSKGVKIYEYLPGFVHAKSFCSDDIKAVVGTINLDFRSLYLHFECAAYMLYNPVVKDVEKDFQETLLQCRRITLDNCKRYNIVYKILGRALRLVAPLM